MPVYDPIELLGNSIAATIKMVYSPFESLYHSSIIGDLSYIMLLHFAN